MSDNVLCEIPNMIFWNFQQTRYIFFNNNRIKTIQAMAFWGIKNVYVLDLSYNKLSYLRRDMFESCTVAKLNVSHNPISSVDHQFFVQVVVTNFLIPANEMMCCMLADGDYNSTCSIPWEASVCDDLLSHNAFFYLIWIVCLLCLVPGIFCLFRIYKQDNKFRVLLVNLVTAGFGIMPYLGILGVQHLMYQGEFYYEKLNWPTAVFCQLATTFSFLSSEKSLTMVVVIAVQRALVTTFPFHARTLCSKTLSNLVAIVFWFWIAIALVPIIANYIGVWKVVVANNMCLYHDLNLVGPWKYVFSFIFLVLNTVCHFAVVACSYITYKGVVKSDMKVQKAQHNSKKRVIQVKKKMFLVSTAYVVLKFPLILISILTLLGVAPSDLIWNIIAVLVVPLSSIVNPIVYLY